MDLFLVADDEASRALRDSLSEAESLMGRNVDVVTYSSSGLRERMRNGNAFLAHVNREPKQWVAGDPQSWRDLEQAA